MTKARFFQVGGCVRDKFLGVEAKDIDYAVECESFDAMRAAIKERSGQIFLETPKYFTIRAKVPTLGATDYVLCRKDGEYLDGRRPESVEAGTILDDLARRDFTMNAIAFDVDSGEFIDPYNGRGDIIARIIRCVGDPVKRFTEDKLRLLRALRFAITKGFRIDIDVNDCLMDSALVGGLKGVSVERIREELLKCFQADTSATLSALAFYHAIRQACFDSGGLILKPTIVN